VNDKGRSHQQSQAHFLRGIELRVDAAHSRRASEITDILEEVVAGKVREIASARDVSDSVLYYLLSGLANGQQLRVVCPYSDYPLTGLLPRNAPTGISRP
jgi:hypothetical protein